MSVHVLGIRHHGPGSARSVVAALEALAPDCVLVEGPPDADAVLPLAIHDGLEPPVALLVYAIDAPKDAAFYPFAEFSPEWQAIRFGLARGLPVRFIDLPFAHRPARADERDGERVEPNADGDEPAGSDERRVPAEREPDPIELLARAAGHDDRESWWEALVERRRDSAGLFEGLCEAMAALREARPVGDDEARREAWMRRSIRTAEKEGYARIAVVCGAWHAPALVERPAVKLDDALLKGLPKRKVEATWIPWTFDRLDLRSGYGAGVRSPGWYQHLWSTGRDGDVEATWIARAAQLLRAEGLDVSSASVIEAVRLARALGALRDRSSVGLPELTEAIGAVLCAGDPRPLDLVRRRLEVGVALGAVPAEVPSVPLARDVAAQQRSLRLKPSAERKTIALDLREETDRARSRLLHRLALLAIPWGQPERSTGTGTFRESWTLEWRPEFAVALVEANAFGNTVEAAATGKALRLATEAPDLAALTALLDAAVLAELAVAVPGVVAAVEARAAIASDVRPLMLALLPLARLLRYGSVRQTSTAAIAPIVDGLLPRVVVGVHPACASLDDEAAAAMLVALAAVQEALALLDRPALTDEWQAAAAALAARDSVHGLVRGACERYLLEQGRVDDETLARRARLALSPARPPLDAAAWAEGLLRGSAQLLLHRQGVWTALDAWLRSLSPDAFVELLPLVRRAFSGFDANARRVMGEQVKGLGSDGDRRRVEAAAPDRDPRRAALVYPVLGRLLGVELA